MIPGLYECIQQSLSSSLPFGCGLSPILVKRKSTARAEVNVVGVLPIGLVWSYDTRSVRGYSIHTLSTRFCPGKVERRPGQTRAGLCRPACLQSARSPQQREQATHCPRADRGRMREGRPLARLVDEIKSQCTFCSWIVFIMCLDWIQVIAADC